MKLIKQLSILVLMSSIALGQIFINEVDYDQSGTDAAEYFELAGLAGTYNAVTVELINGNGGASYLTADLGNVTLADESNGYGFFVVGRSTIPNVDLTPTSWPDENAIQNGAPDGIVLKVGGTIVDAVAYEGEMTYENYAMENAEGDFSGADSSMYRIGLDGSPWEYGPNSPGTINTGQSLDPGTNYPPSANAGSDQTVENGVTVTLDGSGSSDSDGSIVSYAWSQVSGATVTINNASSAVATIDLPTVTESSSWVFSLEVTDDEGATDTDEVTVSVILTGSVTNLAELRAGVEGSPYTITGEVILTWTQSFRGQKYIQDASAAILIDDDDGIIKTDYAIGDGITGLSGTLGSYGNMLQFVPASDPGPATSTGNTIDPETITLNDLSTNFESYEGELVKILDVTFADAGGTFQNGTTYSISDASGSFTFRTTFYSVDYIGTTIPSSTSLVGIPNSRSEGNYISSRDSKDLYAQVGVPEFQNHSISPEFVTSTNEITVSIDIIPSDDEHLVTAANIKYGTGGSMLNTGEMWLDTGNSWQGIIPAQSGNSMLGYKIEAITSTNDTAFSYTYDLPVASATLTDIADIQANPIAGEVHTVEGVVTIGSGLLQTGLTNAYVQDASGRGINLFNYDELTLNRGDKIKVVGEVEIYYTTIELKDFVYQLVSTGNDLPEPVLLTSLEANAAEWEGTLLHIWGEVTDTWSAGGGQSVKISDGTDTTLVRIWESTGVNVTGLTVGSQWAFVGVESQYQNEFQLLVAYDDDIMDATSVDPDDAVTPQAFGLNPAYPNPFNPSTTISWTLDQQTELNLAVYDVTGREVAILSSGTKAAGTHELVWEAAGLSSGVYFVQLTTPDGVDVQKVMLLK